LYGWWLAPTKMLKSNLAWNLGKEGLQLLQQWNGPLSVLFKPVYWTCWESCSLRIILIKLSSKSCSNMFFIFSLLLCSCTLVGKRWRGSVLDSAEEILWQKASTPLMMSDVPCGCGCGDFSLTSKSTI
jgi:hypothetical protein